MLMVQLRLLGAYLVGLILVSVHLHTAKLQMLDTGVAIITAGEDLVSCITSTGKQQR